MSGISKVPDLKEKIRIQLFSFGVSVWKQNENLEA